MIGAARKAAGRRDRKKKAAPLGSRKWRLDCSGNEQFAEMESPYMVVVVKPPRGWKPKHTGDVPPNAVRYVQESAALAAEFAFGFNEAELEHSTGWWAVPVFVPEAH